ncbi:hypothetical protein HON52_02935 [Candidatus Uhrbacteria bacterium]|mgnify:CR=1 FL=1|jgi:hypothetical protein|nr:hypothetical protein [Candidatus Uhrbacteria bacterium]
MAKKEEQPPIDTQLQEAQRKVSEAEKDYQRNVRMIDARPIVGRLALGIWALFDLILVLLFLFFVFGYLVSGQFADRQSVAEVFNEIGSLHDESLERAPFALLTSNAIAITFDDGKYDFYSEIENGNEDWYATFKYGFETEDGEVTDMESGFVLPSESRPLIQLSVALENSPSQAELIVEDVVWQRVDTHEVADINSWMDEHENFVLSSSEYGDKIVLEEDSVVRSMFTVENDTPYNYWSTPFWIVLERGGTVVGVNQATIAGFEAGEIREVTVNWFGRAPTSAQDLRIYPVIDYFDEDVYMDQQGGDDLDSRDGIER